MSNSNYNFQIQRLLLSIDDQEFPLEKVALLKEAIAIADRNNDVEWGFDLRLQLIMEEKNSSKCIDSFHAFAWLIDAYESNSELFDDNDFLWEYKWMIGSALKTPVISFDQIELMSEDYKRRLTKHGFSFRAGYFLFLDHSIRVGNREIAYKINERAEKEENDDQSNCQACELDSVVNLELTFGDMELAISKAQPLITKQYSCAIVPFITVCALAKAKAKKNEIEETKKYLELAEDELIKQGKDSSVVDAISDMIFAYAKINSKRGIELFSIYASPAAVAEPYKEQKFAINAHKFFQQIDEKELQISLSPSLEYYTDTDKYSVEKLIEYFEQKANYWKQQFDKRNENNGLDKCVQKLL